MCQNSFFSMSSTANDADKANQKPTSGWGQRPKSTTGGWGINHTDDPTNGWGLPHVKKDKPRTNCLGFPIKEKEIAEPKRPVVWCCRHAHVFNNGLSCKVSDIFYMVARHNSQMANTQKPKVEPKKEKDLSDEPEVD